MVIGVDASRAFVGERTGTEVYTFELLRAILMLPEAEKNEWVLYVRAPKSQIPNHKSQIISKSQILNLKLTFVLVQLPYLWTQAGLAYRTWIDKLDCLWIPAHTLPILRRPGLKTVVTIHGLEYEYLPGYYGEWAKWHLTWSTEYAVRHATRLIAVSEFTKQQLVERLGADPKKISVVREGVSFARPGLAKLTGGILGEHELVPKQYILFVGTVQPRKNLVRLVEAFARLQATNLKLVIAGKLGWMYEEILAAPRKFGVEDRVKFIGYTNDMDKNTLLQNALLYTQSSLTEGFGLPVIEAMAAGAAVVSSGAGALTEIIRISNIKSQKSKMQNKEQKLLGENAGLIFDPLSVEDIHDKLEMAINSPGLREEMAKRGLARAMEFSWAKAARETLNVLTNVK